jgi:hypothetical protein
VGGRRGGASGGRAGGRFGLRCTKPQTAEVTVDVPGDAAAVRERAAAAIAELGAPVEIRMRPATPPCGGSFPSGAMDMVPALVRIDVDALDSGGSRIGAKAASRIADAIVSPPAARSGDGG